MDVSNNPLLASQENGSLYVSEGSPKTVDYDWEYWESSVLTSATSYGVISGSMPYYWYSGVSGSGMQATNNAVYTGYWEFPSPMRISRVNWYSKANPDRWGTNCTMNFYSVDENNVETSIGSASYAYSNAGSNGSQTLDNTVEVSKLKITATGNWPGANGSWFLPISFAGFVKTTITYTPLYAYKRY